MDRFNSKYQIDPSGCWEWTASKVDGYGSFGFRGKVWKAHRVSYVLNHGEIPEGLCVCHLCDNPSCVNPKHLFLGTKKDNRDDMVSKGRMKQSPRIGILNGMCRLTEKQVSEIRASTDRPKDLSLRFGVHYRHIWAIKTGIKRARAA